MNRFALALAILLFAPTTLAQTAPAPTTPSVPAANPADVASPDAILGALYDVISGPAGKKRDRDRFRSLFVPGARMIPVGPRTTAEGGGLGARVLTPEEYVTRSAPLLENNGFFEKEIARRSERFGNILHAFSTYEGRRAASDEKPFLRGINSIQLYNDGTRWWIVTVFWQAESPSNLLPPEYLPR